MRAIAVEEIKKHIKSGGTAETFATEFGVGIDLADRLLEAVKAGSIPPGTLVSLG